MREGSSIPGYTSSMTDYSYTLEVRPRQPVPAVITLRNKDGYPKVVVPEDEAFEMYVALKGHFEGE